MDEATSAQGVPGFEVGGLLPGAGGRFRRARTGAGADVLLVRPGPQAAAVRAQAARFTALASPYVLGLRDVVIHDGALVLVFEDAPGGSLDTLLARRGQLDAAEVVTVAAPLAQALSLAHGAGLVHGALSSEQVLFSAQGRPLLTAACGPRSTGDGLPGPDPGDDVHDLAVLCCRLLGGAAGLPGPTCPRALATVLESALGDDPAARPGAAAFAVALQRAHRADPVRLGAGETGPQGGEAAGYAADPRTRPGSGASARAAPGRVRRSRRTARRRPRGSLVAAASVILLLVAGLLWARGGAGSASPAGTVGAAATPATPATGDQAGSATGPEPDWSAVLADLDGRREQAFARGDPGLLEGVYVEDAPAAAADAALLAGLAAQGYTATAVHHEVRRVEQRAYTGVRVDLVVVDVLGEQVVRDRAGAPVERRPARPAAQHSVVLLRGDGGWRIAQLSP